MYDEHVTSCYRVVTSCVLLLLDASRIIHAQKRLRDVTITCTYRHMHSSRGVTCNDASRDT